MVELTGLELCGVTCRLFTLLKNNAPTSDPMHGVVMMPGSPTTTLLPFGVSAFVSGATPLVVLLLLDLLSRVWRLRLAGCLLLLAIF